jgi:hypothetical protein
MIAVHQSLVLWLPDTSHPPLNIVFIAFTLFERSVENGKGSSAPKRWTPSQLQLLLLLHIDTHFYFKGDNIG